MDFFKSGLKTVLGAPEPGHQPSGAETVERLVDRVTNSTLLEDRRDACRALKAMSRKYRVEVGAQGMDTLKQVLELDRADNETINYALDTLNNVMSPAQFEEEEDNPHVPMNIGEQFTEMFIKDPHNIQLVLDLLDEYDFRVRLSSVQLLTSLLTNRPKDIQEIILVKPMGVSKMMDLLADTREVIRNETLLLLIKLTKGNANIQKIVAFENAFDRLFEIVSSEGYSDGGIIVEDCLLLMLNLLKNNSSNINFFKEGSYIQKMLPMFNTPDDEELGWSPQKVSNVHCMLQIVRTLVSPSNSAHIISSCQKIMKNVGLLEALCNILMASGVPADILTETINTVGEVVRGDVANQDYLGNVMAPSNPPRPAIVVLLMSMVNEKQPFSLRCAVLYCYQCYLYHNEMSQAGLVQTLLPSSTDVSSLTSGQLLCGGLFSSDALSNWFAAAALLRALCDNPVQKEQLLRVLLATNIGSSPVTLLHQCTLLLQQTTKLQSKVALLMLLSQWMSHCPAAVSAFLKVPGGVGYLVNQTCSNEHDENEGLLQGLCAFLLAICIHFNDDSVDNYSKDSLKQLLLKRIGMETFVGKLSEVSKHELYSRAAKHPQLRVKGAAEILIDYEFTRLFKVLESVLVQSLTAKHENGIDASDRGSPESETLEQYKTLIRQQDGRLHELVAQVDGLVAQNQALQNALNDAQAANSHLKDENTLLKAQVSAAQTLPHTPHVQNNLQDGKVKEYESRIHHLSTELEKSREALKQSQEGETLAKDELDRLRKDQDDLLELLADQDMKINELKMRLVSLGQSVDDDPSSETPGPSQEPQTTSQQPQDQPLIQQQPSPYQQSEPLILHQNAPSQLLYQNQSSEKPLIHHQNQPSQQPQPTQGYQHESISQQYQHSEQSLTLQSYQRETSQSQYQSSEQLLTSQQYQPKENQLIPQLPTQSYQQQNNQSQYQPSDKSLPSQVYQQIILAPQDYQPSENPLIAQHQSHPLPSVSPQLSSNQYQSSQVSQYQSEQSSPNVNLQHASPNVNLQHASPNVNLQHASPNVNLQHASPNVNLQHASPNVNLQHASPNVNLQHASPNVNLQHPLPNVNLQHASPNVNLQQTAPFNSTQQPFQHSQLT